MFETQREDYVRGRINSALNRLDERLQEARERETRQEMLVAMLTALSEAEGYILSAEQFGAGQW